MEIVSSWPHNI